MRYNSTYDALVALNEALGGDQTSPISEYDAVLNVMSTLTGEEVSGDVLDVVSDVVVKADNGELPIQGGEIKRCRLRTLTVKENGHYTPTGSFEGWNKVVVDIKEDAMTAPEVKYLGSTYSDMVQDEWYYRFNIKLSMSKGTPTDLEVFGSCQTDLGSYTVDKDGSFIIPCYIYSWDLGNEIWLNISNVSWGVNIDGVVARCKQSIDIYIQIS